MRKLLLQLPMAALAIALSFVACKKEEDPCKNVSCLNGGTCNNGSCNCAAGYEGSNCGTEWRAKFVGNYNGNMACSTGNFTMNLSVNNSSVGVTSVVMSDGTDNWVGTLNGSSSLTISAQTISGGTTISGSGQLSGNVLTLNLTLAGGGTTVNCTYTGTKL